MILAVTVSVTSGAYTMLRSQSHTVNTPKHLSYTNVHTITVATNVDSPKNPLWESSGVRENTNYNSLQKRYVFLAYVHVYTAVSTIISICLL